MPDRPSNPPVNPDNLDEILPPPPRPDMPMMLGFICVAGLVLYPISFFTLLFPDPTATDLAGLNHAPLGDRLLMFAVATLKAVAFAAIFQLRRWGAWLYVLASLGNLGLHLYFGKPLFIDRSADGQAMPGRYLLDLIVLFNLFAYRDRLKS
jgi:hypothetical protein